MAYSRFDGLEIIMQQDDKISAQLEEVDERIDTMMRLHEEVLSENAYIKESYEDIDYNTLTNLEESNSLDMVDQEVDDLIDANELNDDMGNLIDLVAGL